MTTHTPATCSGWIIGPDGWARRCPTCHTQED